MTTPTGFIATVEADFVAVEHFIETLVTDLAPVAAIIEPSLTGWGKLAVDVLNAISANTASSLGKANITSTINSIIANPAIAQDVLKQTGHNLVSANLTTAAAVGQALENVATSLSGGSVAATPTATVAVNIMPAVPAAPDQRATASPQSSAAVDLNNPDHA